MDLNGLVKSYATPVVNAGDNLLNVNIVSGGTGGGSVTIADGADVAEGSTIDSAITTDINGTISGKIRGLVKILGSVWDSLNGRLKVDGSEVTQPVSASALPLPAGASTSTLQNSIITALGSPFQAGGNIGNTTFEATQSGVWSVSVSNFPGTQPVSGSVSVSNFPATQPISAATLPLPSGAATSALQSTINTTLGSPFQAGGSIGNTSFGISGTLPAFAATPTVNLGTLNGAATSALQTTGNTSLANLDVLLSTRLKPADTLAGVTTIGAVTSITNPVSVTGTFWQATQPISAASLPLPSNAAQETGGNLAQTELNTDWGNASNRTYVTLYALLATGATSETALSLTPNKNGTTSGAATSYTVTSGKSFRITSISADVLNTTTVCNRVQINLRAVPTGGSLSNTSPLVTRVTASSPAALAAASGYTQRDFPEGIILPAGTILGAYQICSVTTASIVSVVIQGYEY